MQTTFYHEIKYDVEQYGKPVAFGWNENYEETEDFDVTIFLETFKLRKNFSFNRFVYLLNYYEMMEYLCAISQVEGWFDESKCSTTICPITKLMKKIGYTVYRRDFPK